METAISGSCQGGPCSNISVVGLVAENFANHAQCDPFEGAWYIDDCEMRYNHGTGVGGHTVRNSHVHHNGQIGGGAQYLVEGNLYEYLLL